MAHQWIQEKDLLLGPECKAPRPPQTHGLYNRKGDVFDHFGSAFNNMKFRLFCPIWHCQYGLTRPLASLTTDRSLADRRVAMLLDILRHCNAERGTFWTFIHCFSLVSVYEKSRPGFLLLKKSSICISKSTCTCMCVCISIKLDSRP